MVVRLLLGFDVLACPRCDGRLRLIALIEETAVIGRILRHLGLPTDLPVARPARAPPLLAAAAWRMYVLHAFQKKSTKGISTSRRDLDLVEARLKVAEDLHRNRERQ
jgi:hypothetical protein